MVVPNVLKTYNLRDQFDSLTYDNDSLYSSIAISFFDAYERNLLWLDNLKVMKMAKDISNLEEDLGPLYEEVIDDTLVDLESNDFQNMVSLIKDSVEEKKKKLIIVSHSQGNFYANRLWRTAFGNDAWLDDTYQNYWGNLQIATPTGEIAAEYGRYITAKQDMVIQPIPSVLPANYDFSPDYKEIDRTGHSLALYLSNIIEARQNNSPSSSYRALQEIFLSKMNHIAYELAPNCGCDDTDFPLARFINQNGEPGGIYGQNAIIEPYAFLDPGSIVCGQSHVKNYSWLGPSARIYDSVLNSGFSSLSYDSFDNIDYDPYTKPSLSINNATIKDSTINGFAQVLCDVVSTSCQPILIENSTIDSSETSDFPLFNDPRILKIGGINSVQIGDGVSLTASNVFGDVILRRHPDSIIHITNSVIENKVNDYVETEHLIHRIPLRVSDSNIMSSLILYEGSYTQVRNSGPFVSSPISNVTVIDSTIETGLNTYDGVHLIKGSDILGRLTLSGDTEIKDTFIAVDNSAHIKSSVLLCDNPDTSFLNNSIEGNFLIDNSQLNCVQANQDVEVTDSEIVGSVLSSADIKGSVVQHSYITDTDLDFSEVKNSSVYDMLEVAGLNSTCSNLSRSMIPDGLNIEYSLLFESDLLGLSYNISHSHVERSELRSGQQIYRSKIKDSVTDTINRIDSSDIVDSYLASNSRSIASIIYDSSLSSGAVANSSRVLNNSVLGNSVSAVRSDLSGVALNFSVSDSYCRTLGLDGEAECEPLAEPLEEFSGIDGHDECLYF